MNAEAWRDETTDFRPKEIKKDEEGKWKYTAKNYTSEDLLESMIV